MEHPERRASNPIRTIEVDQIADLARAQRDDGSGPGLLIVIVGVHLAVTALRKVIELGVRVCQRARPVGAGRERVIRTAITAMKLTEVNGLHHSHTVPDTELGVNETLN